MELRVFDRLYEPPSFSSLSPDLWLTIKHGDIVSVPGAIISAITRRPPENVL